MLKKECQGFEFIFGPVPSRRLGVSLGVDIMPHKTCSLDCVYCECGPTTQKTIIRQAFTPIDDIKRELRGYLQQHPPLDVITFSGAGEPTLHLGLGEIVAFIKKDFPGYKIALLTNSTLFSNATIRKEIRDIDLIVANMDAATPENFERINRPHPQLTVTEVNNGLIALSQSFRNQLWIEYFVIPGLNDTAAELNQINGYLSQIRPARVQINTLDRPGAEEWVQPAGTEVLKRVSAQIEQAEAIEGKITANAQRDVATDTAKHLLATLRRRPCTAEDLQRVLGLSDRQTDTLIRDHLKKGTIHKKQKARGTFFIINNC